MFADFKPKCCRTLRGLWAPPPPPPQASGAPSPRTPGANSTLLDRAREQSTGPDLFLNDEQIPSPQAVQLQSPQSRTGAKPTVGAVGGEGGGAHLSHRQVTG